MPHQGNGGRHSEFPQTDYHEYLGNHYQWTYYYFTSLVGKQTIQITMFITGLSEALVIHIDKH